MVAMEKVADILNAINDALEPLGFQAVGYDNICEFLTVMIEEAKHEG